MSNKWDSPRALVPDSSDRETPPARTTYWYIIKYYNDETVPHLKKYVINSKNNRSSKLDNVEAVNLKNRMDY